MRRFALLLVCAVLVSLVPATSASAAGPAAQADRALDRALRGLVAAKDGPPGAIAVVQRGGDRRVHSAGVADVENGSPLRARRQMRIASVAKAFSGAAALSLIDAGLLGLDDTISAGHSAIRTTVRISAENATSEQLKELVQWATAHSPVGCTVCNAPTNTLSIGVIE